MSNVFPTGAADSPASWRKPAAVGVIAMTVCLMGGLYDPVMFLRAYLPAWLFFLGLALGSMALLMIYHLIGGAWGVLLRRIAEAAMRTMLLVAVLFLPIALGIGRLFPWAQPELVAASAKLQHETFYLNRPYFFMRAAAYFALWLGMSFWLGAWSRRQDSSSEGRLPWKCEQLSAFGAVIYGITLHFAAIDWAMSLMPAFHSTIWGPLFALGQLLSALSLAVIVFAARSGQTRLAAAASPKAVNDMGSLMLTFLIAWAYMAWFQFMLIWIANLPVDIIYFLPRTSVFWLGMSWAVVILHFVVPFFLLLLNSLKRNVVLLSRIAGLILFMQLVYMYYQITPMFPVVDSPSAGGSRALLADLARHWMDFVMPVALGGIWLACFLWQLGRRPLLVEYDPQLARALHLRRLDDEEAAREEAVAHE